MKFFLHRSVGAMILMAGAFVSCASGPVSITQDLVATADTFDFDARRGDWLVAVVNGSFDTELAVTMPGANPISNDDYVSGAPNTSVVVAEGQSDGRGFIQVKSHVAGERGRYSLQYSLLRGGAPLLQKNDELSQAAVAGDGRFVDRVRIPIQRGGFLFARLSEASADLILKATAPGGQAYSGDDPDMLLIEGAAAGPVELQISSYRINTTATYKLETQIATVAQPSREGQLERGTEEKQTFSANRDGLYLVRGLSTEFDIKLDLKSSGGQTAANDDNGIGTNALAAIELKAGETLEIMVSAVGNAVSGKYEWSVLRVDSAALSSGQGAASGSLEQGDERIASRYERRYDVDAPGPGVVIVDVRSAELDTLVRARAAGDGFENDDFGGDQNRSVLAVPVAAAGKISIIVTSYRENATGPFQMNAQFFAQRTPPPIPPNWREGG